MKPDQTVGQNTDQSVKYMDSSVSSSAKWPRYWRTVFVFLLTGAILYSVIPRPRAACGLGCGGASVIVLGGCVKGIVSGDTIPGVWVEGEQGNCGSPTVFFGPCAQFVDVDTGFYINSPCTGGPPYTYYGSSTVSGNATVTTTYTAPGVQDYRVIIPPDPSSLPITVFMTATVSGSIVQPGTTNCVPVTYTANGEFMVTKDGCGCSSCNGGNSASAAVFAAGTPDNVQGANNGVDFEMNLGTSSPSYNAGILLLKATAPSNILSTPGFLQVPALMPNVQVLTNTAGVIQQVYAPEGLVNVQSNNAYKYQLQCFYSNNVTAMVGGLYGTNAAAFVTYTVQNPDGATNDNRLWITENRLGTITTYQYTHTATSNEWDMLEPDNYTTVSTWTAANSTNSAITNSFRQITSGTTMVSSREMIFQYPADVLIKQVDGVGSTTATTTYAYYTNGSSSNLYQSIQYPNGNWIYYQYDFAGRKTNEYSAYGNSVLPAGGAVPTLPSTQCKLTQYAYTLDGLYDDGDPNNPTSPLMTTVSIPSGSSWREVSRTYHRTDTVGGYDYLQECMNPGAASGDTNNLVTSKYVSMAIDFTQGHPLSVYHSDGTVTSYSYPDQFTTIQADPDGSQTTTVVDEWGNLQSVSKEDLYTGAILSDSVYIYTNSSGQLFDSLERSYNVIDLAGRTTSYTYDCCNLDSVVDPDGVTTDYAYDSMKRRIATAVYYGGSSAITTSNILDGSGRVLTTKRVGTNGTVITLSQSGYDVLGRPIGQTNALGGVTTTTYSVDGTPLSITNVYSDGGTRIETYYADGRLQSVTGTAVAPVEYFYGAEQDAISGFWREYTQTVKLTSSGTTNEWTKTYVDGVGHQYKSIYASPSINAVQTTYYNGYGQVCENVDPDGVATLYQYNQTNQWALGQLEFTAIDVNQNGAIDFSGSDRIAQVERTVVSGGSLGNAVSLTNYQFKDGQSSGTAISSTEVSANGLTNWQSIYPDGVTPLTTTNVISPGTSRTLTTMAPDGSYTVTLYSYGRLASVTKFDSTSQQIAQTTYGYDAHGRQSAITDARNGTTFYTFNNADQVATATTPNPGSAAAIPEITTTYYDSLMRPTNVVCPDGTIVTNVYYPTGTIQSTYGSRTYPVGYSYDAQERMTTMTNWTNFATGAGSEVTTWHYDPYRGFLTNKSDAGNHSVIYGYTSGGRLASRVWASGTNTTYSYNTAGDLTTVIYSDTTPGLTNNYDRLGRKISLLCGATTTSFIYNLANNLLCESNSGGILNGVAVTNEYDSLLRRTNLTALDSAILTRTLYGYDNASRLETVSDGTNKATYTYLANSPLVGQITFAQSGTTRMTTVRQYDLLNRLTSINSTPSNSFAYLYNSANQRILDRLADGSYWHYEYDALGQVTAGKKYWPDETPVAGQQFDYAFDTIGNRTQTMAGGDQNGLNLRLASYTNNSLNQITSRDYPGYVDVMGDGLATNPVTVNSAIAYQKNEYFRDQLSVGNTSSAVWEGVTVSAPGQSSITGYAYIPKAPENYTYDLDGNLLSDGRWNYTWDAENRLKSMTSLSGAPNGSQLQLSFTYDYQGRRIQKGVAAWSGSAYTNAYTYNYVYDGWNCIGTLNPSLNLLSSFMWGLDLSGSMQGAGGVGGLIGEAYYGSGTTNCFVAFDGNGNVSDLISAADGTTVAYYEYGPFGELIRATGIMAKLNPIRFSSKFDDDESDLLYYGYRYYNPSTGRWLGRDPLEEQGGLNLYTFVNNNPQSFVDILGLQSVNGDCETIVQFKKGITKNVAAIIYMGLDFDLTVKKCGCCYQLEGSVEGEIGGGWKLDKQGAFSILGVGIAYEYGFELSIADLKAGGSTSWSWCLGGGGGHDETLIRVVDFTIGPTVGVNGSVSVHAGKNVSASASISGSVYANARVIGALKITSDSQSARVDAVGAAVANAGYSVKGVVQVHLFNFINIPVTTFLDIHDDVGGGDVLDPPLEELGLVWSSN